MATPLITIKNWFKTGLKPTQAQFWATWDSFWHKDDKIPSATIDGLQVLLDGKMDKKAITATVKAAPYVAGQAYVFDALVPEYVSFSNPQSANPDYQAFGWYLLLADASGSDTPEVAPAKWQYIGRQLGDITIEDVFELRKELDDLNAKIATAETIDVNAMSEYVPGDAYEGGDTYVSYVNLESPNEQFQSPAIYRAVVDALAGQTPETHPYDPETGEGIWWYLGTTITLGSRVTCRTSVMSVSDLMLIEGAQDRDVCGVIGLIESIEDVYTYYQNATTGVKPANIPASDPGRWVLSTARPIAPRYIPYALQLTSTQLVTHQGKLHYFKSLTGRTAFTFNLYQHTSMLDNGLRPAYSIIIDNRDNASNMAFTLAISSGTLIWGASGSVASVAAGKVLRIEVVATKVGGAYVYYAMHDAGGGGTIAIDAVPTAGSTNAVQSGGVKAELDKKQDSKVIEQMFKVNSTTDVGEISCDVPFKINTITPQSGLIVTCKTSAGVVYTLGATVAAFDFLTFKGDVTGKTFLVRGEKV